MPEVPECAPLLADPAAVAMPEAPCDAATHALRSAVVLVDVDNALDLAIELAASLGSRAVLHLFCGRSFHTAGKLPAGATLHRAHTACSDAAEMLMSFLARQLIEDIHDAPNGQGLTVYVVSRDRALGELHALIAAEYPAADVHWITCREQAGEH